MKLLYVLMAGLLLLGSAAAGQFSLDLKVDTYVDKESPDANFSTADLLWASSLEGEPAKEVYLGFRNIFGSIGVFNSSQVQSAVLVVHAIEAERAGNVTAYFLEGIKLGPITWNDREEVIIDESAKVTFPVDGADEVSIDATPIVKKAVDKCAEGCDFTIVLLAEDSASIGFASKENPDSGRTSLEFSTVE